MRIVNDEVMIYGMHISPYEKGNIFNKDPLRERKLLMHRYEINKLKGKIQEKGYTLVPLQVYFKGSLVKVEIGLARGKKLYDKRADIAKKDQRRELEKDFKVKEPVLTDRKEGSPWMAAIPILPLISSPFMPQWNVWSGGWILSGRASRWQTGPVQKKTICLAVSPALKSFGIPGRPRLFEVNQKVREVNAARKRNAPGGRLSGSPMTQRSLKGSVSGGVLSYGPAQDGPVYRKEHKDL